MSEKKPPEKTGFHKSAYGKPADGERRYAKPSGDGERRYAKPADGERRFAKPSGDGERRYTKPADGERRYAKPVDGESRFAKPSGDGERRYAKPADGERRFAKPSGDGERRFGRPAVPGADASADAPKIPRAERPHIDRRRYARPTGGAKPTARIQPVKPREDVARMLAFLALQDVFRDDAYAALALGKRLRESLADPDDKKLATYIFYAAVENRLLISYILAEFAARLPEPVTEDILHIALAQIFFMDRIPDHAVVDEAVKLTKRLEREDQTGFVNGVLRTILRAKEAGEVRMPGADMPPASRLSTLYSVPEPLVKRLTDAYGEEFTESMLKYKPDERLESLRPNFLRMNGEEFSAYARKKRWDAREGMLPGFLLVSGAGDLAGDPDYRSGLYSIQGAGSALAAEAVGAKPGMNILDACAAPGGKSCLIAERMNGAGRVQAWDSREHRVELIRAAAARLGLDNIRPATRDATVYRPDLEFAMDAVLIDAPCSGLGVMINKPDVKYRYKDEDVESLVKLQEGILNACCHYVKPGGTLVYSTCTVLPEENAGQIARFLSRHDDFKPDTDASFLPEALRPRFQDGMIQLQAHLDGMEGFFIAKLKRV